MKSPDGNCWRGTLDNSGTLQFVQVDYDGLITDVDDKQQKPDVKVKIYPNPAGENVFISITPEKAGAQLEITDINGRSLHTENISNTESCIDLSGYSKGVYIFNIYDSNGMLLESKKVIRE
nr:T9SS type A sorting domain-containing protein [Bacteroidota bacterium]